MTIRWVFSKFLPACLVFVIAGYATLISLTYYFEPVEDVLIVGPERALLSAISNTEVIVVSGSSPYIVVRGRKSGFVKRLYHGGAWLVLPGSISGCLNPENWKVGGGRKSPSTNFQKTQ